MAFSFRLAAALVPLGLIAVACGGAGGPDGFGDSGSGGSAGSGGAGGATTVGGSAGAGGVGGLGGSAGTGGAGGIAATGGMAGAAGGTGGVAGAGGSGGATGVGGSAGTGGSGGDAGAGGSGDSGTGGSGGAGGTADTGGSGGTAGTGGAAGSGGSAGADAGAACRPKFASGVNVAWFSYASDVPNPNMSDFNQLYTNIKPVGGRVVRWWFHTNGTVTPGYNSTTGLADPISTTDIQGVEQIVNSAYAQGEAVTISLWAFDMLDTSQVTSSTLLANNRALLTTPANRTAYANNVLTPLVTALKGNPGVYAWEIFNEPEGMINDGPNSTPFSSSITMPVSITDIQACTNVFAAAIHAADPAALVTNGAWTFLALGGENGPSGPSGTNYYSDSELVAAGGQATGTLNFYEVHYYDNWGTVGAADPVSPFIYTAASWKLTKPIVVGEFWAVNSPASGGGTIAANSLYTTLYKNGYAGGWAWQYANSDNPGPTSGAPTKWPAMEGPMEALVEAGAPYQCQ
jgi:hypothetical protein